MPNLGYSNAKKTDKIAGGMEILLRKELGSSTPLAYELLPGEGEQATAKSILADMGKSMIMAKQQSTVLFYIHFALDVPRPFELNISVTRYGRGALIGRLAYIVPLNKPVPGKVRLDNTKAFRNQFVGDAATIANLNSNRDLIRTANKLVVSRAKIGQFTVSISPRLEIIPNKDSSVLLLDRVGEPGFFWGADLGAKNLLAFIPQLEASL